MRNSSQKKIFIQDWNFLRGVLTRRYFLSKSSGQRRAGKISGFVKFLQNEKFY